MCESTQHRKLKRRKDAHSTAPSSLGDCYCHTLARRHKNNTHTHPLAPQWTSHFAVLFPTLRWESFFKCDTFPPPQSRFLCSRVAMSKWEARSCCLCQDARKRTRRENKWWWNKKPTSPSAAREVIASESGHSRQGVGQAVVCQCVFLYTAPKTHVSSGEGVQSLSPVVNHSHNNATVLEITVEVLFPLK